MWRYLLKNQINDRVEELIANRELQPNATLPLQSLERLRFKDWEPILNHLHEQRLYPVFLIDEFTYYRELAKGGHVDASFLAEIREFALEGKASFVIAGTDDLRKLIKDSEFGVTGQFVNAIETRVSYIDEMSAVELISAMGEQLKFTADAMDHICQLSFRVPYFIQILCKHCAIYAKETGRSFIGAAEVETVAQILTGEQSEKYSLSRLPPGKFSNNMYTATDPQDYAVLLTTICDKHRSTASPRPVAYTEIQEAWAKSKVPQYASRLAGAIRELVEREILIETEDEGIPAYQISVDLFRRWWQQEHRYLKVELDEIKQDLILL